MQIRWLTGPPDELNLLLFAPPPQAWSQSMAGATPGNWTICAGQPPLASQLSVVHIRSECSDSRRSVTVCEGFFNLTDSALTGGPQAPCWARH